MQLDAKQYYQLIQSLVTELEGHKLNSQQQGKLITDLTLQNQTIREQFTLLQKKYDSLETQMVQVMNRRFVCC